MKIVKPDWPVSQDIRAFCSTRKGGHSSSPFNALNLGLHVGDNEEKVLLNRKRLQKTYSLPATPLWLSQTHTNQAIYADEYYPGIEVDAIITRTPNQPLVVMTADCLPLLITSSTGNEVAAIHAGWVGLSQGIIQNTIRMMANKPQDLRVWLCPCISQDNYEVGIEVKQAFEEIDPQAKKGFVYNDLSNKYHACLKQLAVNQLLQLGIKHYWLSKHCTFNESEDFFSYRRDKITGRIGSFIWIDH